jgi:curved DNA-binding protein CbpA
MKDAFDTLQLPKSASLEEIDKKWRELVRTVHPDKIGAAEGTKKTQILNEAHEKAKKMYHESECTQARRLQQQSNGTSWREKSETEKKLDNIMENAARNEAVKASRRAAEANSQSRWKEEMTQTINELHTALETESARANKAEQMADESIQMAERETEQLQQACAEIQMKDTQLRDLQHQNKEKDMFMQEANLKNAEITAELDQKAKQLVQSEQERAVLEEKLLKLEASLEEEKQRAEMAEDRAKEWENKYIENAKQCIDTQVEACMETDDPGSRKRKHVKHFETREEDLVFKNTIKSFLQTRFQANQSAFVPSNAIHQLFIEHTGHIPNNQVFYKTLRTQMCVIFPAATICERRITGKKERGYSGIQLMT